MAQKFVSLDEAAKLLGISKDHLGELREAGKVRAYRDGASWKFRADDVEKLVAEGIPAAGSDVSLGQESPSDGATAAATSDIQLDTGDDDLPASAAASDISLEDLDEPTVPADGTEEGDVLELSAGNDADELSDSILLSETELGESTDRPPSTIIGKAEMAADLDLELAGDSSAAAKGDHPPLIKPKSSSPGRGDAVLDTEPPGLSDNFGDLDELEIDLEAESSRILAPEDVTKAKRAAKAKVEKAGESKAGKSSDLELAPSDSSASPSASGGVLESALGVSGAGLSGLSSLELEGSDIDDEVLGDGSDITLSSESSGINIISPSDSGLALDEVKLELGSSSPIGSSLDLGAGSEAEAVLEPLEEADEEGAGEFALTPFGEEAVEEEEDSSQIIPLDEVSEDEALLGTGARPVEALADDFAAIPAGGMMAVGEPVADTPFPGWIIGLLSICVLMMTLCGMMVFDLMRNMWSWDQVYTLNSTLLEVLNPFLS
jgi:excisionase family DNA binding protein